MTKASSFEDTGPGRGSAVGVCRWCEQPLYPRPALGDPGVWSWVSRDADGTLWVTCYSEAPACQLCSGTGDDPDDPEMGCLGCDGIGLVSDTNHEPRTTTASAPLDAAAGRGRRRD